MRIVATALLAISLLAPVAASAGKVDRLESYEQDHYYALKPFLTKDQDKVYLKLKTSEERDAWLKENYNTVQAIGVKETLWEQYYKYDEDQRATMAGGEIKVGYTQEQVVMAYGRPYRRERMTKRTAQRSELFRYRFEVDKNGHTWVWQPKSKVTYKSVKRYTEDVYLDDAVVTDIKRRDGWN